MLPWHLFREADVLQASDSQATRGRPAVMPPNVLNLFRGPLGSSEDFSDCRVATVIGRVELNGYQHAIFLRVSNGVV